uniref:Uncharacterized protein n=1 Tax=Aegilops tauschii subsp. strangulata TaxID=200361 RepID=A0A453MBN2_AEGTS
GMPLVSNPMPAQILGEIGDVEERWTYMVITHFSFQVSGTTERPRLSVFRSNKHLYAQVIDDTKSCTLASASTMHKALSKELEYSAGP